MPNRDEWMWDDYNPHLQRVPDSALPPDALPGCGFQLNLDAAAARYDSEYPPGRFYAAEGRASAHAHGAMRDFQDREMAKAVADVLMSYRARWAMLCGDSDPNVHASVRPPFLRKPALRGHYPCLWRQMPGASPSNHLETAKRSANIGLDRASYLDEGGADSRPTAAAAAGRNPPTSNPAANPSTRLVPMSTVCTEDWPPTGWPSDVEEARGPTKPRLHGLSMPMKQWGLPLAQQHHP